LNVLMPFIIMIFIVNYPLMITFTFWTVLPLNWICKRIDFISSKIIWNWTLNIFEVVTYVCCYDWGCGTEQYKACPQGLELAVSMAKHMSLQFENMDTTACMAFMCTYSCKSQMGVLKLLTGNKDVSCKKVHCILCQRRKLMPERLVMSVRRGWSFVWKWQNFTI
jgi:hypothetical protein